ncbi:hypothetical protein [Streptomyces sp. B22F1]|uniref:hypothetical protein n=1 Tax=Streptomyces sp. B22F1 TaxID=3153566 RepID=UPI00325CBF9F
MTTPQSRPRLLPWTNESGRPCYAEEGGWISKYADRMERQQLDTGNDILRMSRDLVTDKAESTELRFVAQRLTEALSDALRIAESRGARLGARDEDEDEPT